MTKPKKLSVAQATALWQELRNLFVNAAAALDEIIQTRAWEPLGYESFSSAWASEMANITLAKEIRPHVVYQMLADGLSVDEITHLVKGIGPDRASSLARQRQNGVPADHAVVQEHLRKKPRSPEMIHVRVGSTLLNEYKRIADHVGQDVEDIARDAIADRFRKLATTARRRA